VKSYQDLKKRLKIGHEVGEFDRRPYPAVFSCEVKPRKYSHTLPKASPLISTFDDLPSESDRQVEALDIIRFVFSASYYAMNQEEKGYITLIKTPGPVHRKRNQKPLRIKGKVQPLRTYSKLDIQWERNEYDKGSGKPLDKETLSLLPVLVRPHIRLYGEKVILVDSYSAHRWKREDIMGRKVSL
jgi:hypothetical protein